MAVTLRLARHGRKKRPFYRIVAADKAKKRDGRYLERLGTVDPLAEPATVELKDERVKYWLSVGARPSQTVAHIIEKQIPGHLKEIEEKRLEKIKERRAKRKAKG